MMTRETIPIFKQVLSQGWPILFPAAAIALIASFVLVAIYRLLFSPIARFPGPKLAAITALYESYYSFVKDGQWGKEVTRMHEKYGPIVRINPWEVSIRDSLFYNELYVGSSVRRTNMWPRGRQGNGFEGSHHLSVSHDLHRNRRKHLENFFSRQSINRFESVIAGEARLLDDRIDSYRGTKTVVNLDHAFTALTGDIIGNFACGSRLGLLEEQNFSPAWHEVLIKAVLVAPVFKGFPWLSNIIKCIPRHLLEKVYPKGVSSKIMGDTGKRYIEDIQKEIREEKSNASAVGQKSVFHHLLVSDIPEAEKSTSRLQAEAMILLIAGSVTSAHTISLIVYYVLSSSKIEGRLRDELKKVMSGYPEIIPSWVELEKLPYLQGCVKEALRLNGLIGNLTRISPDHDLQYKQWTIPKNTPIGMSIHHMHTDPAVWADPLKFVPERWLEKHDSKMERNFVPFTKGSRSCLGINLAMAELYITTAVMFRPNAPDISLYETDQSSVEFVRDYVMGFPKAESKGVRIMVH